MCKPKYSKLRSICNTSDCTERRTGIENPTVNASRQEPSSTDSVKALQLFPRLMLSAQQTDQYNGVLHWCLPTQISQSRLGDRPHPSNACTIIALAMANIFHRYDLQLPLRDSNDNWVLSRPRKEQHTQVENMQREMVFCLPEDFLRLICNGIVDGNTVHSKAMEKRKAEMKTAKRKHKQSSSSLEMEVKDTFTVPQAVEAIKGTSIMHEIDFVAVQNGNLESRLPDLIKAAVCSNFLSAMNNIYLVLIVVERAVLIVYQRKSQSIAIFDSHTHKKARQGAMIGVTNIKRLRQFSSWMIEHLFPELKSLQPASFELSCVQILGNKQSLDAPNVVFHSKVRNRIFRKPGSSHKIQTTSMLTDDQRSDSGYESESDNDERVQSAGEENSLEQLIEKKSLLTPIRRPPLLRERKMPNLRRTDLKPELTFIVSSSSAISMDPNSTQKSTANAENVISVKIKESNFTLNPSRKDFDEGDRDV